jgi:hypothetical protein
MDTPSDPIVQTPTSIEEAHALAATGDFQRARRVLDKARQTAQAPEVERLDAAQRSFHLDPAGVVVVVLTALALAVVIASSLFH